MSNCFTGVSNNLETFFASFREKREAILFILSWTMSWRWFDKFGITNFINPIYICPRMKTHQIGSISRFYGMFFKNKDI